MKARTLRRGDLAFSALEAGEGPLVLCLHGFPDHARTYRFQLPALAAAGYRAVAVTLRGYEPTSQPRDGRYGLAAVAEDVVAWLDALGAPRAHLVGHDWGAMVSYTAAALAPERFASLVAMSVPHLRGIERAILLRRPIQLARSWYVGFFQLRGLAERVVLRDDLAFIARLWRDWSPGWAFDPAELAAVKATLSAPGVLPAALAYYRALAAPFGADAARLRELLQRPLRVPTLAVTGARDGCVDTRLFDDLARDPRSPRVTLARVEGAGHFVQQERPDEVNALLLRWFAAHA